MYTSCQSYDVPAGKPGYALGELTATVHADVNSEGKCVIHIKVGSSPWLRLDGDQVYALIKGANAAFEHAPA